MLEIIFDRVKEYYTVFNADPVYMLARDVVILELKHLADLYVADLEKKVHNPEWHSIGAARSLRDEIRNYNGK